MGHEFYGVGSLPRCVLIHKNTGNIVSAVPADRIACNNGGQVRNSALGLGHQLQQGRGSLPPGRGVRIYRTHEHLYTGLNDLNEVGLEMISRRPGGLERYD